MKKKVISIVLAIALILTTAVTVGVAANAGDGSEIDNIAFSFTDKDFGYGENYVVPMSVYQSQYQERSGMAESMFEMNSRNTWTNSSFGMCVMASALYENAVYSPSIYNISANRTSELEIKNEDASGETLQTAIERAQASWFASEEFLFDKNDSYSEKSGDGASNAEYMYYNVYDYGVNSDNRPIIVFSKTNANGDVVNHAVLAYDSVGTANGTDIFVYDPDCKGDKQVVSFTKNTDGDISDWSYGDYTSAFVISHYTYINAFYREYGSSTNLLNIPMDNFELYVFSVNGFDDPKLESSNPEDFMQLAVKVEGGEIVDYNLDGGKIEITPAAGSNGANSLHSYMIKIYDGLPYVIKRTDKSKNLVASFGGMQNYARIDADADMAWVNIESSIESPYDVRVFGDKGNKFSIKCFINNASIRFVEGAIDHDYVDVKITDFDNQLHVEGCAGYDLIDGPCDIVHKYDKYSVKAIPGAKHNTMLSVCLNCHDINYTVDHKNITQRKENVVNAANGTSFDIAVYCADCNELISKENYFVAYPTANEVPVEKNSEPEVPAPAPTPEVEQNVNNGTNAGTNTQSSSQNNSTQAPAITKLKATSISKVTPAKGQFKATWKKVSGVTGYKVQYSTDKNFKKGVKTVTIKGASKTSATVKKLKSKKTYYVRVQTYKGSQKSAWSKSKSVKIK